MELNHCYDDNLNEKEKLPKIFTVNFKESVKNGEKFVKIFLDDKQAGDIINDNSREEDFYRYHDVFHYVFACFLSWSPVVRALANKKRKSIPSIDKYEDGARALITEEAISLMVFNEAKRKKFFLRKKMSKKTFKIIHEMVAPFEVHDRTHGEWKHAFKTGYDLFRKLKENKGGTIKFDHHKRTAIYI